jgi:Fe-Mn family superoxide dismutase
MRNAPVPGTPILGMDLWEHSFSISIPPKKLYRFFFNVVNWEKINDNYEAAIRRKY